MTPTTTGSITPYVLVLNVSLNTEGRQCAVIQPLHKVIKDFKAKLSAKYKYNLLQYKKQNKKLVVSDAAKANAVLATACEEKHHLVVLNLLVSKEN
jgi:hypothetical protein